ncbi:aminotransferase class I/II-fold pyridoxal phosphate-dependent enzyme [Aromatoleum toluvorans]|uniref:Aminotransferase class I/II-fold pyridoxal phosphate-dependent enzyme n=1 Tax=Aromatoleum toluvorans TaxID=92002 RepID=A0ABX1PZ02_9RHOO|nr:DegT/DnrJ/EryC1/StrS family aminotransferase [Aromatoleum toluvorans]NMG43860.1 aminotransferase class I/II-fold pyridoxal phosphate-dependent enzyme [Aromatoleum toluvorans]
MNDNWIPLSDPDMSRAEIDAVTAVLGSPRLSAGPRVEAFEDEFADYVGRRYGIAVASGTLGLMLGLRALGLGPGDEVIAPAYGWHQVAHAIAIAGATPVFAEIDYWSGCLAPDKVAQKIGPKTRAILAGNSNGHPAAWNELRQLATAHGLKLVEDSTEAIGSRYQGRLVGGFGDFALFDFSQPSALCCGEGGMIVTDDPELASELRYHRSRALDERFSISIAGRVPTQAGISELTAALGLAQLERIDEILARRKKVESHYLGHIQSFEGIKPPYLAPEIDEVHWMLFLVHLGTRFTQSARNQIVDDLATESIEAAAFCNPLHQQYHYTTLGYRRGDLKVTEKIADRALALPFHAHLDEDQVAFIVQTAKDSSVNVGAGAAIY